MLYQLSYYRMVCLYVHVLLQISLHIAKLCHFFESAKIALCFLWQGLFADTYTKWQFEIVVKI